MNSSAFFSVQTLQMLLSVAGLVIGIFVLVKTLAVIEVKRRHAAVEERLAKRRLIALEEEESYRQEALDAARKAAGTIAKDISQRLIDDPTWLDRFMQETGVTYGTSVYGQRIGHFFHEKRAIADAVAHCIDGLIADTDCAYCLVIDSGTTMYPVFDQIGDRVRGDGRNPAWRDRVCVVTNNLPGVQYLMKNGKLVPGDDYSELGVSCYLVPGNALAVYAAVTGTEAQRWLERLPDLVKLWFPGKEVRILGLVTGNYFVRHQPGGDLPCYYPVARGEGHVEFKEKIIEVSDRVLLLSPLMKFSYASLELLNAVNGFTISRGSPEAGKHPSEVAYKLIEVQDSKEPVFFTTQRARGDAFYRFSQDLVTDLKAYYERRRRRDNCLDLADFRLKRWIPGVEDRPELETIREIPHERLRVRYQAGDNIWNRSWVEEDARKRYPEAF